MPRASRNAVDAKGMEINADFAGRIQETVHLFDSLTRRRANRFFRILQSKCQ
jgi:hypothetical protein